MADGDHDDDDHAEARSTAATHPLPLTTSPRPILESPATRDHSSPGYRSHALEFSEMYTGSRSRRSSSNVSAAHITMLAAPPPRPSLPRRGTVRGSGTASSRNITEALRLARAREEQETLLGENEQADDDGCYPPRENDDPRKPNPHLALPVYTTIHKIRRLVIATIGMCITMLVMTDGGRIGG